MINPESKPVIYLLALAYRNSNQIANSWATFKQILPTHSSIAEYKKKVDFQNKKVIDSTSITGDDSGIHYQVDFYSHF